MENELETKVSENYLLTEERKENLNTPLRASPKCRSTLAYLCFFGGILGLHQFYVKRKWLGILYLCTLGLFGLGIAIDMQLILFGAFRDENGFPIRD